MLSSRAASALRASRFTAPAFPALSHFQHFQRLGQVLSRHRLLVGAKALLIVAVAIGAFSGCRATGGGIPGIEPPNCAAHCACGACKPQPDRGQPVVSTGSDTEVWSRTERRRDQYVPSQEQHLCRGPGQRPDLVQDQGPFAETPIAGQQPGFVRQEDW
jgi:hypothetical protein